MTHFFVKNAPVEAPVITRLRLKGLLHTESSTSFCCPICGSTATYTVPTETAPYGDVHCKCGLELQKILDELDMRWFEARVCPVVSIGQAPIHELAEACEAILAETGKVFACAKTLYCINFASGRLSCLEEADLTRLLSQSCVMVRYDGRSKALEPVDPPTRLVRLLLGSHHTSVPTVEGVCRQPFLREDGSLGLATGYISELKMVSAFDAEMYRPYAWTEPLTRQDAQIALAEIRKIFSNFCPADEATASAMICGALEAVQRVSLKRAPMLLVQGNAPGIGKSTLARVYCKLATPEPIAETSYPETSDECAKQLLSSLSSAPGAVFYDNAAERLPAYPALCTCLTEPVYERRVLQRSALRQVITRTLFVATGNFVSPEADLRRRVLPIKLIAPHDQPEQRQFDRDVVEYVESHRAELVMKGLRIVAAYLQSGEKVSCRPLAGMEMFTHRCREPLIWLGEPDPLIPMLRLLDERDEDELRRHALLRCLQKTFNERSFSVADIARHLTPELFDSLADLDVVVGTQVARKSLGWLLRGLSGFPVRDLVLVRMGKEARYAVKGVECL